MSSETRVRTIRRDDVAIGWVIVTVRIETNPAFGEWDEPPVRFKTHLTLRGHPERKATWTAETEVEALARHDNLLRALGGSESVVGHGRSLNGQTTIQAGSAVSPM